METAAAAMPTVGAVLLVITHVFLIPAIVLVAYRGYPVDVTVLLMLLVASILYHVCLAGWHCEVSLSDHRVADHSMVYITLTWLYLTFCAGIRLDVRFSVLLGIIFLLIVFNERLFRSFVFAGLLLAFFVLYAIVALFWIRLPLRRFDLIFACMVLGLFVAGFVLHLIGGDANDKNYWWCHSLWHIFAMVAIGLFLLLRDGFILTGLYREIAYWKHSYDGRIQLGPHTFKNTDPRFFDYRI